MSMRLAVTVGDPAGIGPEVVLKALARGEVPASDVVVYGPLSVLRARAERLGLPSLESRAIRTVDVPLTGEVRPGVTSAAAGHAAADAVLRAARAALSGEVDALVTAPL